MRSFNIQNIIIAISNKTFVYDGCSKIIGKTRIFLFEMTDSSENRHKHLINSKKYLNIVIFKKIFLFCYDNT